MWVCTALCLSSGGCKNNNIIFLDMTYKCVFKYQYMCVHTIELYTIHSYTVQLWMVHNDSIVNDPMRYIPLFLLFWNSQGMSVSPCMSKCNSFLNTQAALVHISNGKQPRGRVGGRWYLLTSQNLIIFQFLFLFTYLLVCLCAAAVWKYFGLWRKCGSIEKKGILISILLSLLLSLLQY